MNVNELVRIITSRYRPAKETQDTPSITLEGVFWFFGPSISRIISRIDTFLNDSGGSMTDDTRGFINVIRDVLLREDDAGLSADGVPANSAWGGHVDGIGIGARGEPSGIAHRKRKRLAKAQDPKLFKALSAEGHVEFDLLSDVGQRRFCEGKSVGAIEVEPILPNNHKEIEPSPRKRKSKPPSRRSLRGADGSELLLNPVLPTRFEDRIAEELPGGTPRIDM